MSDAPTSIERRDDALSKIVGTGNTRAMLEEVERNVRDVIDIARDRGFVTRFNNRDFFGFPAWSLLALTYGLVPFVEWTRPIDGGWEARAVVRTRDGDVVSSAEAMCTRQEAPRQRADDHTLRAMAQTRAMRNALRACLGAALVMAGFDFADPAAPATNEQVGMLHQLERELGMTHAEGHAEANVTTYKELSREDASVIIDRWTAAREAQGGEPITSTMATQSSPHPDRASGDVPKTDSGREGEARPVEGDTSTEPVTRDTPEAHHLTVEDVPRPVASAVAWERATSVGLTATKAKAIAKTLGIEVKSASDLTGEQLASCLAFYLDKDKA